MRFNNQVVLVTGASRGIGRETAIAFSRLGAKVIINYRNNDEAANLTLEKLEGDGHMLAKADLGNPESLEKMVSKILHRYDHIHVLINNAGIFDEHPIDKVNYQEWQETWNRTIAVNLTGVANLSYLVAQSMMKQKAGSIINVSSRGAFRGEPECLSYGASKGGLNSFSQSLAKSLGKYNISVIALAPGFVATDMAEEILQSERGDFIRNESPFKRVAKPEEVANTIVYLAHSSSKFLSGGIVDINGASFLRM